MRLGFSVAAHIQADVLLLDEVFAVGDEAFQRKCFGKIFEFKQRGGTIVFVSHDAPAVERLCDRAVLLRDGAVAFDGPTHEAIAALPPAARRRAESRGARGRPEGVGRRQARIERVRLLDAGRRRAAAVRSPASRSRSRSTSSPTRRSRRRVSARAARRRGDPRRGRRRLDRRARLGRTAGELPLRFEADRLPLADGRLPSPLRAHRRGGRDAVHSLDDAARLRRRTVRRARAVSCGCEGDGSSRRRTGGP